MRMTRRLLTTVTALALAAGAAHAGPAADALPTNGQVAAGAAVITQSGATMNIRQSTQRAVINWGSFDVGSKARVDFVQPNASAATLNRVNSASASMIEGAVNANGQVTFVNPNGVVFGQGAEVSTGAIVATTMNVSDADFMAGGDKMKFQGGATGQVINKGKIKVTSLNGYIALMAPQVINEGVLVATMSGANAIALVAGQAVTLTFGAGQLLSVNVDASVINALISNKRLVKTEGGQVIIAANSASDLRSSVINNGGVISASAARASGGKVTLVADTIVQAGTVAANGGLTARSSAAPGVANVVAAGANGGQISLQGNSITLAAGSVTSAQGAANGGTVNVGINGQQVPLVAANLARQVSVEQGASVNASSIYIGKGGEINIWSSQQTSIAGTLTATGGALGGDGGMIETSSLGRLNILPTALVNAAAPLGRSGSWLLDPEDLTVDAALAATLSAALRAGNVTVAVTRHLIIGADALIWSDNAGTSLSLLATDSFTHNGSITAGALNISADNVTLSAGSSTISNQTSISARTLTVAGTVSTGVTGTFSNGTLLAWLAGGGSTGTGSSGTGSGRRAPRISGVSATAPNAGSISFEASQSIWLTPTAKILANGEGVAGGDIFMSAPDITLQGALVQTNGSNGRGGTVLILASQSVSLDATTRITANAVSLAGATQLATAGEIYISGYDSLNSAATLQANGDHGGLILMSSPAGMYQNAGYIQTNGGAGLGGTIAQSGLISTILSGATLEANGTAGGGNIITGRDFKANPLYGSITTAANLPALSDVIALPTSRRTAIDPTSTLRANATHAGNGGNVLAWGDALRTAASFSATGGPAGGNGGLVETSGDYLDVTGSTVSAHAPQGTAGTWLLDPFDVIIASASPSGTAYSSNFSAGEASTILASDIVNTLNAGTSVTISTGLAGANTIYVNTAISATTADGGSLILTGGNLRLGANISTVGNQTYNGAAILTSAVTLTAGGAVSFSSTVAGAYGLSINSTSANSEITGVISEITSLSYNGAAGAVTNGVLTLSGASRYAGNTSILGGTLKLVGNGTLGGTASANNYYGTLDIASGATFWVSSTVLPAIFGVISGSGAMVIDMALNRVLQISANNTYSGNITIYNGGLKMAGNGYLGGGSYSGSINLVATDSRIWWQTNASQTFSGTISGLGRIEKQGGNLSSVLTLSGANTYSGGTYVGGSSTAVFSSGPVKAGSSTAFGTGLIRMWANGVLDLNGQTISNALTLNGTGISSGGALINSNATAATYAGLITLGSASSIVGGTGSIAVTNIGSITGSGFGLTLGGNAGGTLSSVLATGAGTLTKVGAGTWTLAGANTYTGTTTISAGTLKLGAASALGDVSGGVSVTAGAVLDLNGQNVAYAKALTLNGTGVSLGGALINSSATPATYAGRITLGSASSVVGGAGSIALTNAGSITGSGFGLKLGGAVGGSLSSSLATDAGTLTKEGAGTWTLTGANTYTGGTTISTGTLQIGSGGTVGSISGNVDNSGVLSFNRSDALTFAGLISGAGTVSHLGTGTTTLSGNNTYTGGTIISAGTLALGASDVLADAGGVTVSGTGTLSLDAFSDTVASVSLQGAGTITGSTGVLTSTAAYDLQAGTASAILAGSAGANKTTSGTVTLNGANTYTGGTIISAGTLALGASDVLADAGGVTVSGTGTLSLDAFSDTVASVSLQGAGTITGSTGVLTSTAAYDLQAGTASAILAGSAGANKTTSGTVTLSGANTYTGETAVNAGTLTAGVATNAFGNGSDINVNGGTLDLGAFSQSVGTVAIGANGGSITGAGTLTATTSYTFSNTTGNAANISAALAGTAVSLTQAGTGTTTLSGANTYDGATSVNAGTLAISGSGTLGNAASLLTITATGGATSATLDLQTNVTVGSLLMSGTNPRITNSTATSSLTVNGTSTLANAITTSGLQTYTGAVTLGAATTLTSTDNASTINLAGTVNGAYALTVNNSGTTTLGGTVGVTAALASVTTDAGGTLNLNGGSVITTGAQTYNDPTTLGVNTTLSSTNGLSSINLAGTVNGAYSLTVSNAGGSTTLGGAVGGTTALTGLSMTTATLSAGAIKLANTGTPALSITNTSTASITGIISGTSASLTKAGAGTLTLSGVNTYGGGTMVSAGTLKAGGVSTGTVGSVSSGPMGTGSITVGASASSIASLDLSGQTLLNSLSLAGGGAVGALLNSDTAQSATVSGSLTLAAASSMGGAGGLVVGSAINAAGYGLALVGSGAYTLSNAANALHTIASYSTGIGSLALSNNGALSLGAVTLGASTYSGLASVGAVSLSVNGTLTMAEALSVTGGSANDVLIKANAFGTWGGSALVSSAGALTVQPFSAGISMGLGNGTGALAMAAGLFNGGANGFATGFSGITLGNGATGNVTLGGALVVTPSLTVKTGGNITINAAGSVRSNGAALVLDAAGNFVNGGGAAALSAPSGHWVVYSTEPALNTFGGLVSGNEAVWSKTSTTRSPGSITGHGYVFSVGPAVTVSSADAVKTYGQTVDLSAAYTFGHGSQAAALYGGVYLDTAFAIAGAPVVVSSGSPAAADAGTYTISVSGLSAAAYTVTYANTGVLTVNRAPLGITVAGTYTGTTTLALASYTLTGLVNGESLVPTLVTINNKNVASNGSNYVTAITGSSGTASRGNYALSQAYNATAGTTTNTVTLTPAALTVKAVDDAKFVTQSDSTTGYGGALYNGLVNGEASTVLTGSLVITRSDASNNAAGNYSLTASGHGANGSTNGNYQITYAGGSYTIVPADTLLVKFGANTATYGTTPTYTATAQYLMPDNTTIVTLAPTVSGTAFSVIDGASGSATFTITPAGARTNVNGYAVVGDYNLSPAGFDKNTNNFNTLVTTGSLAVTPATLTLTAAADAKTYGATTTSTRSLAYVAADGSAAVTATGLNGYSISGLVSGDTVSAVSLTSMGGKATATVVNGPYAIVPGLQSASAMVNSTNYTLVYVNGAMTVNKADLKIDATESLSGNTYKGTAYTGGYTTTAVNGDTFTVTGQATGTNVGTYLSDLVVNNGQPLANYNILEINNANLVISPKAVTVTNTASSTTYDGVASYTSLVTNAGFTSNGMVDSDAVGSVTQSITQSGSVVSGVAQAGSFTATPSAAVMSTGTAGNYSFSYAASSNTVAQANLTVSATASGNVYSGSAFTGTYTTTALGSDAAGLSVSGMATGTNAGTYTSSLAVTGAVLTNYNTPTLSNANLVISAAPLGITVTGDYNGTNSLTMLSAYTLTGLVNGETLVPTSVALNDTRVTANGSNFVTTITAKTGTALLGNYSLTQAYNPGTGSSTNTATLVATLVTEPVPAISAAGSGYLISGAPAALYRIMSDQFSQYLRGMDLATVLHADSALKYPNLGQNCGPDNRCLQRPRRP